jgi:hypothetical protein
MDAREYLNQNSLTRYPFKDGATLDYGSGTLPNGVFLDAHFTTFAGALISPCLISITYAGSAFTIVFAVSPAQLSNTLTFQINLPGDPVLQVARSSADDLTVGRIEIDKNALQAVFDAGAISPLEFTPEVSTVCASAVRYAAPVVTQLDLKNYSGATAVSVVNDSGLTAIEGTNLQFTGPDKLIMDVIAGAGAGLYDACTLLKGVVYKINNVTANTFGNFGISTDSCHQPVTGLNSLTLTNSCKPACTETELKAFAHYLNRVKSGSLQVASYLVSIKNTYDDLVAKYSTCLTKKHGLQTPYMLADATTASNRVNDYHSVTCGVYSPSKDPLAGTLAVSLGTPYTLADGTASVIQGGIKKAQAGLGFSGLTMQPDDVIYHSFTIKDDKPGGVSPKNTGDQKYDVQFNLTTTNTKSYFGLPLLSTTPNFTVAYTVLNASGTRTINISIDMLFAGGGSQDSSLVLEFPVNLIFGSGSLTLNETTVTPMTDHFGFEDVSIDYSKKATYALTLACTSPGSSYYDVPMTLITPLGRSEKVVRINM